MDAAYNVLRGRAKASLNHLEEHLRGSYAYTLLLRLFLQNLCTSHESVFSVGAQLGEKLSDFIGNMVGDEHATALMAWTPVEMGAECKVQSESHEWKGGRGCGERDGKGGMVFGGTAGVRNPLAQQIPKRGSTVLAELWPQEGARLCSLCFSAVQTNRRPASQDPPNGFGSSARKHRDGAVWPF